MKNKWNSQKLFINYILSSSGFKTIFLIMLVLIGYAVFGLGAGYSNSIDAMLAPLQFPIFNLFFFVLLFLNTINTIQKFNEHYDTYILRLENRKKWIKNLLKNVLIINLIYLLFFSMFFIVGIFLTKGFYIEVSSYGEYGVTNVLYLLYYFIRYLLLALILSVLNIFLYQKFGGKFVLILNILFVFGFFLPLGSFYFLPWIYFTYPTTSTFSIEFLNSLLFIFGVLILLVLFYKLLFIKPKYKIKYLVKNDVFYFVHRTLKYWLLLFGFILISIFLNWNSDISMIEIIHTSLGINLNFTNISIVEILVYLFNIIFFVFLIFTLFFKDLKNLVDYLFLRIPPKNWVIIKIGILLLIVFFIKLLEYIVVSFLLFFKLGNFESTVLVPFILDFLYIGFVVLLSVTFYLVFIIFRKRRIISILLMIILVILFPKNIISLTSLWWLLILLMALNIIIIDWLFKKYNKQIIQLVGGR